MKRRVLIFSGFFLQCLAACSNTDMGKFEAFGTARKSLVVPGDGDGESSDSFSPLTHILSGIDLPEGKVPVVGRAKAPPGKTFGLYASAYSLQEDGGEVFFERGYHELVVRPSRHSFPRIPQLDLPQIPQVSARVRDRLAAGEELIGVSIWLRNERKPPLYLALQRAVLGGDVRTQGERSDLRSRLLEERQAAHKDIEDQFIRSFPEFELSYRCLNNPCVMGRIPAAVVARLEKSPLVDLIESLDHTGKETDFAIGSEISRATQLEPWWGLFYSGHGINGNEAVLAFVEEEAPNEEHIAFKDSAGSSGPRFRSRTKCVGDSDIIGDPDVTCFYPTSFNESWEGNHASGVLGIIMGDPHNDSSWNDRRGITTEAEAHVFAGDQWVATIASLLDDVPSKNAHVMNMSWGSESYDTNCTGNNSFSRKVNAIYESGTLPVIAAGNEGNSSTSDCTVVGPGAALGAVTVAGLGGSSDDTTSELRSAEVASFSSRGGTSSQGGGRAIIDIAAPAARHNMVSAAANSGSIGHNYASSGTSFAAPYVSATALNLVDWSMRDHNSFLVDNPGLLHAFILLMGDTYGKAGSKRFQGGIDNLYGAGRLQARLLNNAGLDNPWAWQGGWLCVKDGQETEVPITTTPIGDIDVLKVAMYYYQPNHDNGGALDHINLYVERSDTGAVLRGANAIGNEYAFLAMRQGYGGSDVIQNIPLRLVFNGIGISSDNRNEFGVSCGQNEALVWYAYFYEDSDRETSENLGDGVCTNEADCAMRE